MDDNPMFNRAKPYLAVVFLQFGSASTAIIAKSALNQGLSHYTFVVYRYAIATAAFAPFAMVLERKERPRMTISIFLKIMLLGLLEPVIDQNLYYMGMKHTTASFASAMCNILPAITFLLAWILGLELVNIRRLHSQAKVLGTLVTVGGAMIMTLIEGPTVGLPWTKQRSHDQSRSATNQEDRTKGALMITLGCFCWSCFYILQAITLKSYPAVLSLTSLICMMGALQGTILTLLVERGNTAIWSMQWDTKCLAVLYSGLIGSGVSYYVSGLIVKEKGPVFVTVFGPLSMVIVAITGSFILAEQVVLGRLIGAAIIVAGLYMVIWGKNKDQNVPKSDGDCVMPVDQQTDTMTDGKTTSNQEGVHVSGAIPPDESV